MTGYAIDVGFALEGSQSQVCPKFPHKEILGLTFSSKQARINRISKGRTDAQRSTDQP
jgi:hypothetical protein